MTRIRALLATSAIAVVVAACSGGGAAASASAPPDADATISAKGSAFEAGTITLPADQPTKVFFKNLDAAPHNVAIFTDASASKSLFVGATITDSATTYDVPAIPAGSYFFRCDVHPTMTGTVVVGS